MHASHDFLSEHAGQLDVGLGEVLQALAWQKGSETAAVDWLQSDPVQALLNKFASILLSNSLEAARRTAQTKKWEAGSDLTHISTASRSAIQTRFTRWRNVQAQCVTK